MTGMQLLVKSVKHHIFPFAGTSMQSVRRRVNSWCSSTAGSLRSPPPTSLHLVGVIVPLGLELDSVFGTKLRGVCLEDWVVSR